MPDDRVLRVYLGALADLAGASVAALFSPAPGRPSLRAQQDLDQVGLDTVQLAWVTRQGDLERGVVVRLGPSVLWPLLDGDELLAMVYLNRAPDSFPEDLDRQNGAILVRRLRELRTPTAVGPALAEAHGRDERERLIAVLQHTAGNVAAAARILGVVRDTVYYRVEKYGLTIQHYRPGVRRGTASSLV